MSGGSTGSPPPALAAALAGLAADIARRGGDPSTSYTAQLLARGPVYIAKKLGEEGVETALAVACADDRAVIAESADLLYHLLVALAARGIDPALIADELQARRGISGLAEKASRPGST